MKGRIMMVGMVGQWLGLIIGGVGIGIEIAMKAHIGYIMITVGAMLYAVGTKYKYNKPRRVKRP